MAGHRIGSQTQQLENLKTVLQKKEKKLFLKGDNWYLVAQFWFEKLKKYVEEDGRVGKKQYHPGPVNNKSLFKDDGSDIKDNLNETCHYYLVPEDSWILLVNMFGIVMGQEPVKRVVVEYTKHKYSSQMHYKVEVYCIQFEMAMHTNLEDIKEKKFSQSDTLGQLQNVMKEEFNISDGENIRFWKKNECNTWDMISMLDCTDTLHHSRLFNRQLIVIEIRNPDGTWPTKWNMDKRSSVYDSSVGATENVTHRANTSRLNQIVNQLENIQTFQSRIETMRKDMKEKHKNELNKVMEKQKVENEAFEKDCVTKIKKKKELEKERQGLSLPASSSSTPKCPVCLEMMAPPTRIYNCPNGHLVCGACKPRLTICTICRKEYMGRATAMEQMLRDLFKC